MPTRRSPYAGDTRNPYGTGGYVNQQNSRYYRVTPSSESGETVESLNPRISANGYGTTIDGKYAQIGRAWDPSVYGDDPDGNAIDRAVYDQNGIKYDPEFGWITPWDNVHTDTKGEAAPAILAMLGFGATLGPFMAAGGAGGGAAGGMGMADPWFMEPGFEGAAGGAGAGAGAGGGAGGSVGGTAGGGGSGLGNLARSGGSSLLRALLGGNGTRQTMTGSNGGGNGLDGILGLLGAVGSGARDNQLNHQFRDDINHMMDVGTGGVTNDDRRGARDLVRGIYDGSIGGDQIFDRVPGLRAISDRGYNDIARKMSAGGDADSQSSARLREFSQFNNDLTTKAWNSEMDRAAKIGGFNIDPSNMAGRGLQALATANQNQRNSSASNASNLARLLGGGNNAIAGGAGSIMSWLNQFFSNNNEDGGTEVFDNIPDGLGEDIV